MCGIFGFFSTNGLGPNMNRLRRLALVTESRGRHAFGISWVNRDGTMGVLKMPGAARHHLGELDVCEDAIAMIGHCRFATHGDPEDNTNNHPHAAHRGGVFVHNGVVFNHQALVEEFNLQPETACDSEVFGLLLQKETGSPLERAVTATSLMDGKLAILGLWTNPLRMLVVRRENPLHWSQGGRGLYFASLPSGLPGDITQVPDGCHTLITLKSSGKIRTSSKYELAI